MDISNEDKAKKAAQMIKNARIFFISHSIISIYYHNILSLKFAIFKEYGR